MRFLYGCLRFWIDITTALVQEFRHRPTRTNRHP